jgi:hypothetical protein
MAADNLLNPPMQIGQRQAVQSNPTQTFTTSTEADKKPISKDVDKSEEASKQKAVKMWQDIIRRDKKHWEPDFKRMRNDTEFHTGIQWHGQTQIDDDRYVNNITLRLVQQKVATLYARNPESEIKRKERMDFEIWDGKEFSLIQAGMAVQNAMMVGAPPPLPAMALLMDYQRGRQRQDLVGKVCKTLKLVVQHQMDAARPEFREQLKDMVERCIVCSVGYIIPYYCVDSEEGYQEMPSTITVQHSLLDRAHRAKVILDKVSKGDVQMDDASLQTLKSLFLSMGVSMQNKDEVAMSERVEYDFPPVTSVIPDKRCRSLVEFVAAHHVTREFNIPLDEANAFFGTEIKAGGEVKTVKEPYGDEEQKYETDYKDPAKPTVRLWQTCDYDTKTCFVTCDGWKDYVVEPEPLDPSVSGFWNIIALVFNKVIVEPGTRTSPFPPSDVTLVKHAQREWNRSRDALRAQRNANAPKYPIHSGSLDDEDKIILENATPNQVIELKGLDKSQPAWQQIQPMQHAPVDLALYNTQPLELDIQTSTGVQDANVGPAKPNVTATVGSIAEQSRLTVSQSNIDSLDSVLTRIYRMTAEICLRKFSKQTVDKIVGFGVWPELNREDFLNEIEISIKAGSSGKPNKAMEVANAQQLGPLALQAGANPIAFLDWIVHLIDENIDVQSWFPLPGMAPPPMVPQGPPAPGGPGTPPGTPTGPIGPQAARRPAAPSGSNFPPKPINR